PSSRPIPTRSSASKNNSVQRLARFQVLSVYSRGLVLPINPHVEKHFTGSESVRDVVIGMADGLTVPFALAAGLSAAVTSTHIIVTAGLAEIAAGAIAMGLGGYLAARTDEEHY